MAHEKRFKDLLAEFERVGVDPNTFSAVLAVNPEDALRALRALPDGAGPTAFLAEVRRITRSEGRASPPDGVTTPTGGPAAGDAPPADDRP
ncbi:MAG: hypothetical protein M3282_08835 [Gemmatimonadota bacterium]|nr:hypothetical protein [Gemmatimonadota bacterium]